MLTYKTNGDIHIGPIRVFNGKRQAPVRWVGALALAATALTAYALYCIGLSL